LESERKGLTLYFYFVRARKQESENKNIKKRRRKQGIEILEAFFSRFWFLEETLIFRLEFSGNGECYIFGVFVLGKFRMEREV
jgi:hypothetical protein